MTLSQDTLKNLPDSVKDDIGIYLAPSEKLLKAIVSNAERTAVKGQVWLILCSQSIFFHTCEIGKEPVIALLSRRDVKTIEYFQRIDEVILTFIPRSSPNNVTRLVFANEQRDALEYFCEDLADLIFFKKETATGIKTFVVPIDNSSLSKITELPKSALRHVVSAIPQAVSKPEKESLTSTSSLLNASSNKTKNFSKPSPEVKIVKKEAITPESTVAKTSTTKIVTATSVSSSKPVLGSKTDFVAADNGSAHTSSALDIRVSYVLAATFISVLVAFMWYKFFNLINRRH